MTGGKYHVTGGKWHVTGAGKDVSGDDAAGATDGQVLVRGT